VRYQSLKAAKDKFDVEAYIRRYPPELATTVGSSR
jgi:hypothetical protein